jgi:hypothetical protein
MDFHEIWYLNIFRKCVKKAKVSLKSDQNNGYSLSEKFYTEVVGKIKHMLCLIPLFFLNRAVYEIMWKNMVWLVKPQKPIWRMRTAY